MTAISVLSSDATTCLKALDPSDGLLLPTIDKAMTEA